MAIPADATRFIQGVLRGIGAPVNSFTTQAFVNWLANEQGGPSLSTFEQNKGNPLGIQTPEAQAAGKSGDVNAAITLTANLLKSNYAGIVTAFKTGNGDQISQAIVNSPWNGSNYGGLANFTATANGSGESSPGTATVPKSTFLPPQAGVDVHNFHGYDLSAIPQNELGNAEQALERYVTDPGYAAQLRQRITQDYGYQGSWAEKVPELNAVLIWASTSLDPSTAAGKNAFESAVANTQWWKTTNANQRSWQQVQATDPAQANQALADAREKVLADANQMGVTLTKSELDSIAGIYAANTFVQSGALGSQSGTASEWLDQAITDTIFNIKGQRMGTLPVDFSTLPQGQNEFAVQTQGMTSPSGLFGISAQLYSDFQNIAQQYLMYNPTNPQGSLLTNQDLLGQVQSALEHYTGTGSSFGSSNLIQGAIQDFTQQMVNQASKIYPSLAEPISQGTTPVQYVAPYANLISNMMGVAPGSIDFTSPKWNWVIASPDPKTGVKSALSLDQVQRKLVTMPEWQQSNTAMQMTNSVTTALNRQFGFGGD